MKTKCRVAQQEQLDTLSLIFSQAGSHGFVLHGLAIDLQILQNAWLDLLQLLADFLPHTFLQQVSNLAIGKASSPGNSTITEVMTM